MMPHDGRVVTLTFCIPTRNRPAMATRLINHILNQSDERVEVLVLENSDRRLRLNETLCEQGDRLRILRAESVLGMRDNWERGLAAARGRYITYMADKDVMLAGAVRYLLACAESAKHDIITYRKAWFCEDRRLVFHYECDGSSETVTTAPLVASWFRHPRHIHSAPMIFNSAVSARLIAEIRDVAGRFFLGSSPDVCSGMLISAYRETYCQINSMLAVAHGGQWSNGYATERYGRYHANGMSFLAESGSDSMAALGLPYTLRSGAVELLVAASAAHGGAFKGYTVNWRNYLHGVHEELDSLQITVEQRAAERALLAAWHSVVPRKNYVAFLIERAIKNAIATSPLAGLRTLLGSTRARQPEAANSGAAPAWDDCHYSKAMAANDIDEAVSHLSSRSAVFDPAAVAG